eukprot:scaffold5287_cov345-Prasinococcus_capsulatus_cf.AAC.3
MFLEGTILLVDAQMLLVNRVDVRAVHVSPASLRRVHPLHITVLPVAPSGAVEPGTEFRVVEVQQHLRHLPVVHELCGEGQAILAVHQVDVGCHVLVKGVPVQNPVVTISIVRRWNVLPGSQQNLSDHRLYHSK